MRSTDQRCRRRAKTIRLRCSGMRIMLGPTGQFEPIAEAMGQIWVGRTEGGVEIVAVIAVVGCNPDDYEVFLRETAAGGAALGFVQAASLQIAAER